MPGRSSATARPGSTSSWTWRPRRVCRSTRRTACTARPATSRTRSRTSCGSRPKAAAAPTIPTCRLLIALMETTDLTPRFWSPDVLWVTVIAAVLTVLLLRARPHERRVFVNTLWLFLLGVVGQASAGAVYALDFPGAAKTVYAVFRILSEIALIRLFGFGVFRLLLPLVGRDLPRIIEDLAIVVAYVVYGFVQLRGAGVDLSSIITTSAILTAVLAFAMQDTLGNLLGGLAIQLDNSVRVGDWVRVDDMVGRVRDIRWRSTLIETRNWETVVIPNSTLMKSRVAILGRIEGAPLQWRRILNFMVDPAVRLRVGKPALPAALLPDRPDGGRPHRFDGARPPFCFAAALRDPHRRAAVHRALHPARRGACGKGAPPRADAAPRDARQGRPVRRTFRQREIRG